MPVYKVCQYLIVMYEGDAFMKTMTCYINGENTLMKDMKLWTYSDYGCCKWWYSVWTFT